MKTQLLVALSIISFSALASVRPAQLPTEKDNYINMAFRAPPIINIGLFEATSMEFGQAQVHPWNGSYWPTHKGMLAHRYKDKGFPDSKTWMNNYNYYQYNPSQNYVMAGRTNELSPAEKYDLLMDDSSWTLTRAMWEKGIKVHNTYGVVPGWFGICHGWSAVNHVGTPEPVLPVTLTSGNGWNTITFYPSDIKALASYLWAESNPSTIFIGNRCKQTPTRDEFGRVVEPECFDSNPATWHISVVNRVGRDRDSLVFDSSGNSEVWNYALDSYYFRYFNPMTMKPARHFDEAMVERSRFVADPFAAHRGEPTRYIVGVMMQVFFPAATEPRARAGGRMLLKEKTFIYDLELDENMAIIGGEWHTLDRPDFVWTFPYDGVARTVEDGRLTSAWDFTGPLPVDWAAAGRAASERGKILATVVNGMIERSKSSVVVENPDDEESVEEDGGPDGGGDTEGAG